MGKSQGDAAAIETEYRSVYPEDSTIWLRTTFVGFLSGYSVAFALAFPTGRPLVSFGCMALALAGALFGGVIGRVVAFKAEREPGDFIGFVLRLYMFCLGSLLSWPMMSLGLDLAGLDMPGVVIVGIAFAGFGIQVFPFATAFGGVVLEQKLANATGRALRTGEVLGLSVLFIAVSLTAGYLAFHSVSTLHFYRSTGQIARAYRMNEILRPLGVVTAVIALTLIALPRRIPRAG